jgi:hypothetical protein
MLHFFEFLLLECEAPLASFLLELLDQIFPLFHNLSCAYLEFKESLR